MSIPVIIIPILNRYDLLENMLESINYPVDNILIIDNGGEYKTSKNVTVLNMPGNLGMSASWNLGIKLYPKSKYWLFASADTTWGETALKEIDESSGPDKLMLTNDAYGCFSVGENVIEKIGLFDEYFYPIYFEDNDFHERVARFCPENTIVSTSIQTAPETGSQTINSNEKLKNRNNETFLKNEEYYKYKMAQNFEISKPWSLFRRRDQEWLL
jgi:glycosyltransferase involved in cell wall biosynthesis